MYQVKPHATKWKQKWLELKIIWLSGKAFWGTSQKLEKWEAPKTRWGIVL